MIQQSSGHDADVQVSVVVLALDFSTTAGALQ
jgi:hypothetical protein